jgi:hypothetical protein
MDPIVLPRPARDKEKKTLKTRAARFGVQGNPYGPNHIDVGIIGTTFIFDTLTKYLLRIAQ